MPIPRYIPIISLLLVMFTTSCYKAIPKSKDIHLGTLTSNQIHANPKKYPILNEKKHPQAYKQIKRIVDQILTSPEIHEQAIFAYDSITIIRNDKMVNAFATPGGYIFVFTGLIKLCENEDQLAGIIAHEIAHAELRHSVKKLSRGIGRQALIIAGAAAAGASFGVFAAIEVGNKFLGLSLGRDQEIQADKKSVIYLGTSSAYASDALADFFEVLAMSGNDVNIPPILSTHPDTENRVYRIRKWAKNMKYSTNYQKHPGFEILQNSIP